MHFKKILIIISTFIIMVTATIASPEAKAKRTTYLGNYKITAYCGCRKCSGKWGNKTASGRRAKEGRTIAVDRRKIKLATKIKINGHTYRAEDVGGGVKGKHIDVYFNSHKKALKFGKKYRKVYKIS